jgi:hypothetical protein
MAFAQRADSHGREGNLDRTILLDQPGLPDHADQVRRLLQFHHHGALALRRQFFVMGAIALVETDVTCFV